MAAARFDALYNALKGLGMGVSARAYAYRPI